MKWVDKTKLTSMNIIKVDNGWYLNKFKLIGEDNFDPYESYFADNPPPIVVKALKEVVEKGKEKAKDEGTSTCQKIKKRLRNYHFVNSSSTWGVFTKEMWKIHLL